MTLSRRYSSSHPITAQVAGESDHQTFGRTCCSRIGVLTYPTKDILTEILTLMVSNCLDMVAYKLCIAETISQHFHYPALPSRWHFILVNALEPCNFFAGNVALCSVWHCHSWISFGSEIGPGFRWLEGRWHSRVFSSFESKQRRNGKKSCV